MSKTGVSMKEFFEDFEACPAKGLVEKTEFPWALVKAKDSVVDAKCVSKSIARQARIAKQVVIKGNVVIGSGTVIDPFVVIEGPTAIGNNCEIRSGAWIRPKTLVGNNCVIGHGVELKNTLMFNEAKIGTNAFVGDSVMGKGARAASGVIIGNRRFDQKVVEIKVGNERHSTGTDKFGAILGDFSRLGANAITSPGTLIGRHTWVYGGCLVSGIIPKNSFVKLKQETVAEKKEPQELSEIDLKGKK